MTSEFRSRICCQITWISSIQLIHQFQRENENNGVYRVEYRKTQPTLTKIEFKIQNRDSKVLHQVYCPWNYMTHFDVKSYNFIIFYVHPTS